MKSIKVKVKELIIKTPSAAKPPTKLDKTIMDANQNIPFKQMSKRGIQAVERITNTKYLPSEQRFIQRKPRKIKR